VIGETAECAQIDAPEEGAEEERVERAGVLVGRELPADVADSQSVPPNEQPGDEHREAEIRQPAHVLLILGRRLVVHERPIPCRHAEPRQQLGDDGARQVLGGGLLHGAGIRHELEQRPRVGEKRNLAGLGDRQVVANA